jgi:hypothetical protein
MSEKSHPTLHSPPSPPILGGDRPKILHFSPQNWGVGGASVRSKPLFRHPLSVKFLDK